MATTSASTSASCTSASAWPSAASDVERQAARVAGTGAGQPHMAGLEARAACGEPRERLLRRSSCEHRLFRMTRPTWLPIDSGMSLEERPLRRGWTTGACAAAAAKAACTALVSGSFPDPVEVTLPSGASAGLRACRRAAGRRQRHRRHRQGCRRRSRTSRMARWSSATVRRGAPGAGADLRGGRRASALVTRPGLPIPPGEPAINPVPRQMIAQAVAEVARRGDADFEVEISVPGGERLADPDAQRAAWASSAGCRSSAPRGSSSPIRARPGSHSIHRGIDVARASGLDHVAGATGATSEAAVQKLHGLPEEALIDMGDFVGGMLKYIRKHPVPKVTVAGGVAKMTKLAQGMLDVHSKRGAADLEALAALVCREPAAARRSPRRCAAPTRWREAFSLAAEGGMPLGDVVARHAWPTAAAVLDRADIALEILVFDRQGELVGQAPFAPSHDPSRPRNAADRPRRRARCRGNPGRRAPARRGSAPCAPRTPPASFASMSASVPAHHALVGPGRPRPPPPPGSRRRRAA